VTKPLRIVVIGLSLSSSWGNGHATTYRALLRAVAKRGHDVTFLERDQPWYAQHRDLPNPDFCRLVFYRDRFDLKTLRSLIVEADAVVIGSYVAEGVLIGKWVQSARQGITAFYDIDTPVTLAKLARQDFEYLSPDLIPGYDPYLSFSGGPALADLEQRYGSPAARVLYCTADEEFHRPRPAQSRFDLGYLGTYSADRQPALERLLIEPARRAPRLRFVVAGPQFPDDIAWPANITRIEHVGPDDHADFYAGCRFTLNVTRADMALAGFSPSVRLFEAAACGSPIISDQWTGIETLFAPGREILLAESPDDVLQALLGISEPNRCALGKAARLRLLRTHGADRRATELEGHLLDAMDRLRARVGRSSSHLAAVPSQTGAAALRSLKETVVRKSVGDPKEPRVRARLRGGVDAGLLAGCFGEWKLPKP
jgi:spore maturation protein CgeB